MNSSAMSLSQNADVYDQSPFYQTSSFRAFGVPILGLLLILMTVVGNLALIVSVRYLRRKEEPGNFLFVSLAVADMLLGMMVMPIACVYDTYTVWILDKFACDLWTYLDVMLCTSSILHLCAISLDRYCTIRNPLNYGPKRSTRRILIYILIVWVGAFLVSLPAVCGFRAVLENQQCQVNPSMIYQIYATMVAFYIPVSIMLIVNCRIYAAVKQLAKKDRILTAGIAALASATMKFGNELAKTAQLASPPTSRQGNRNGKSSVSLFSNFNHKQHGGLPAGSICDPKSTQAAQERKAARNLTIIMGAFIICWFPFFATTLTLSICEKRCDLLPRWWTSTVLWLGYTNSALNPILVFAYNKDFKDLFHRVVSTYCCPRFIKIAGLNIPSYGRDNYYSEASSLRRYSRCNANYV